MATLLSAAEFKERFDISDDIETKRITPHIGSASRRLRKWVGAATYEKALNPADNDGSDADLVTDLKNAEAHLTYHFAIFGFNYPLSSKGIVATTQSGEGRDMRKYLNPSETREVSRQMLELALEIAEPHCIAVESATLEIVEFNYGGCSS